VTESIFQRDPAGVRRAGAGWRWAARSAWMISGRAIRSISILCEMRFDAIKVDRALMKGALAGNESLAMIRAVAMADSLEMITIAKGVETPEELQIACSLGCRRLQGMAYGGARSVDEVQDLFGTRAAPPAQEERAG
jgi:EAL domain-containing protein (putative c-di-GMP-specific phosphodiesterase class I)